MGPSTASHDLGNSAAPPTGSATPLTKQERERAALAVVYGRDDFEEFEHLDRPDFVCRLPGSTRFGVEVTDLFRTEADARAQLLPPYVSDLLAGGPHLHRDDESILSVSRVEIRDKDGNLRHTDVPAILRPQTTCEERAELLANVIRRKSASASGYRSDLDHVNLVVMDWTDAGPLPGADFSVHDLLTPKVREALRSSPYRELSLVGEALDGSRYYRPLRMLALMESFFIFVRAVEAFDDGRQITTPEAMVRHYVAVMRRSGEPTYLARSGRSTVAVDFGAGVRIHSGAMNILDFRDKPLPPPLVDDVDANEFPFDAFARHYEEFRTDIAFITALSIKAARTPDDVEPIGD